MVKIIIEENEKRIVEMKGKAVFATILVPVFSEKCNMSVCAVGESDINDAITSLAVGAADILKELTDGCENARLPDAVIEFMDSFSGAIAGIGWETTEVVTREIRKADAGKPAGQGMTH